MNRDAAAHAYLVSEDWITQDDDIDPELTPASWDECLYDEGNNSWLVLTDDEADTRTAEYIRESLWAFRPEFLVNYVTDEVDSQMLRKLGEMYEDANPVILALIGDRFEEFVEDAISADGRGHFLAGYDGEEIEFEHGGTTWFIYRT